MPTLEHWHSPTVLSDQDVLRMQRDAEQRVRRMQQQANETIRQAAGGTFQAPIQAPAPPPPAATGMGPQRERATRAPLPPSNPPPAGNSLSMGIQQLFQDKDRVLLLALLILLKTENADLPLLLALGYLLL